MSFFFSSFAISFEKCLKDNLNANQRPTNKDNSAMAMGYSRPY